MSHQARSAASSARPAAAQQQPGRRMHSESDDVADDVEDLTLDDAKEDREGGGRDREYERATRANGQQAAGKKAQQRKPPAADDDDHHSSTDNSDVDEPKSDDDDGDVGPPVLPPGVAPPPPPAQPPPDDEDSMLTASGKVMQLHKASWGRWATCDYAAIKVRGVDYMFDGVKIPPPCPPTMEIVHLEIYMCDQQVFHVCSKKGNWLREYKAAQAAAAKKGGAPGAGGAAASSSSAKPNKSPSASPRPAASASSSASDSSATPPPLPDMSSGEDLRPFAPDFFFVVNFHVQTAPTYHLTLYFQRREVALANRAKVSKAAAAATKAAEEYHEPQGERHAQMAFDMLFRKFVKGDTAFRNSRLKLIPFVVDGGNWFVNKAVGNRPCIIGNKMTTTYHCDPRLNYMEVDIDVSGSSIGSGIFRVVKGYAAYLTIDLTLLIQGQEDDELPEVILGGCRLRRLDLAKCEMRNVPPPADDF